jgi:hypothetical protein
VLFAILSLSCFIAAMGVCCFWFGYKVGLVEDAQEKEYTLTYWSGNADIGVDAYDDYEDAKRALVRMMSEHGTIVNHIDFTCVDNGRTLYTQEIFYQGGTWYNWTPLVEGAQFMKINSEGEAK